MLKREVLSPRSMAVRATPIFASNSSVFAWMPRALVAAPACGALSIMRQRMPRRRRSLASARPTGPAPTIKTSGVAAVRDKSLIFLLSSTEGDAYLTLSSGWKSYPSYDQQKYQWRLGQVSGGLAYSA